MSASRFRDDLASFRRVLSQAALDKRLALFLLSCREGVRWHTVGDIPKPDVIDALREIGLAAGLAEEDIQDALGEAVARPFDPGAVELNGSAAHEQIGGRPTVSTAALVIRRASEIEPQAVQWLWRNRIALGKQTIIAGEPGLGKSQLTLAIAANVTNKGRWPRDEGTAPLGSAIILSAEDDAADTIRPRLDAAGADASRV